MTISEHDWKRWNEKSVRDDWHLHFVGSDIRQMLGEIERLRAALYEVTTNGRWTEGEQFGDWAISNAVYETARDALGADEQSPSATDGK